MSEEPGGRPDVAVTAGEAGEHVETDWQRRRRLARVFGDVLPETTADERDPDAGGTGGASEAWLKAQVPPHHG